MSTDLKRFAAAAAAVMFAFTPGAFGDRQNVHAAAADSAEVSADSSEKVTENTDKTLDIVVDIFPVYDWVREITAGAEDTNITLLSSNGVDIHSFQPSVDDIISISTCDVFIYVGGESENWIKGALDEAVNGDMIVIDLLSLAGDAVKEEEIKEGMQSDEHEHEFGHDEEAESEADEHIWLSLKSAALLCGGITEALSSADEKNAALYSSNNSSYCEKLAELDEEYAAAAAAGSKDTVIFADRFPFRYLMDDYGLDYYAAFAGCSAETEASFETILFLGKKVEELGIDVILQTESAAGQIAETVREVTAKGGQEILTMDSLQSVNSKQIEEGVTYISVMQANLEVLRRALQ